MTQLRYFLSALLFLTLSTQLSAKTHTFTLLFNNDESTISLEALEAFQEEWVNWEEGKELINIEILAYCDDKGSSEYNKELSQRRANYIHKQLLKMGIQERFYQAVKGYGEISLKEKQNLEAQRKQNRRVEIRVEYNLIEIDHPVVEPMQEEKTEPSEPVNQVINSELKVGDMLTFDNILFEGGSPSLLKESYSTLDTLAVKLLKHTKYHITIHGHICCRDRGFSRTNYMGKPTKLSLARAHTIFVYLRKAGIDKERMHFKGHGANQPLGKGDKYDRRVEIEIRKIVE